MPMLTLGNFLRTEIHGSVYQGKWEIQHCAAKRFTPEVQQAAIQREIKLFENLRHRHIIEFYCTQYVEDDFYLIMDLAEKGSLANAIEQGELSATTDRDWSIRTRLADEIARALEYMHHEQVIYRNLKSTNILLTRHMEVKLTDFGLATAKVTTSGPSCSSSSSDLNKEDEMGLIRWMAPELFELSPEYTAKSDVFALGMVMWEMAANCTMPFKGVLDNTATVELVKLGEREILPDDTPAEYRGWIERCWKQDPNERPEACEIILIEDEASESF